MLHLILSFLYLSLILQNDKGRPVKICEFLFIYILTVIWLFQFWLRQHFLVKPRKYVYFSGAFGLPLVNSLALAVALQLKADTGKQSLDLRLIVLISGSVFLFSWFVIQMSAFCLAKKEKIKRQLGLVDRLQDAELELMCLGGNSVPFWQPYGEGTGHRTQQQVLQAGMPDPSAHLGKRKLIQERLFLLQHARECQQHKQTKREEWSCSRPQCRTMRKVLKHMDSCQAGITCQVKHCASSRLIISHWENCTQHDCPYCMPFKNMSNRRRNNGSHDNQEMEAAIPADHNEPNTRPQFARSCWITKLAMLAVTRISVMYYSSFYLKT
nr:uncharacterized protein LOC111843187 [Paramormyrops kingsleyae]